MHGGQWTDGDAYLISHLVAPAVSNFNRFVFEASYWWGTEMNNNPLRVKNSVLPILVAGLLTQLPFALAQERNPNASIYLSEVEKTYADANRAFEKKDYLLATQLYSRVIEIDPQHKAAFVGRENARAAGMEFKQALEDYDLALSIDPQYVDAYLARGTTYWLSGNLDNATKDFRKTVELEPADKFYYNRLATVLYERRKTSQVEEIFGRAFREDRTREWALWGWLSAIAAQGDDKKLERTCQKLRDDFTRSAAINYFLGQIQMRRKNYALAVTELESAAKFESDETPLDVYKTLAEAFGELNNSEQYENNLIEYYERTGEEYPGAYTYDLPDDLHRTIGKLIIQGKTINAVAMTADEGWVIVFDSYGLWWHGIPQDLKDELLARNKARDTIHQVCITPSGGWVILSEQSNRIVWKDIPQGMINQLRELSEKHNHVEDIAIGYTGEWAMIFDRNGYWGSFKSDKVYDAVKSLNQERRTIRGLAFTPSGGAVIRADERNGYWALAAPQMVIDTLDELNAANESIDVVYFSPGSGWLVYSASKARKFAQALHGGHK